MEAVSSLFSRGLIFLLFIGQAFGQDQMGYVFTAEQGVYQPLTGGTVIWSDSVLVDHSVIALPQMTWNGLDVNSMLVSSNGWIRLGSNINAPQEDKIYDYGLPSIGSFSAIAFGHILEFSEIGSPAVLYDIIGDELIVEYRDVRRIDVEGERLNFQISVNLTNTNIVLSYGIMQVGFEAPNLRNKPSSSTDYSYLQGWKTHEFSAGIRGNAELAINMRGGKHWMEATLGNFNFRHCHIDPAMPQDHLVNGARYVFTKVNGEVGCQDPIACDYDAMAQFPGKCNYNGCGLLEYGCMDELACNFNPIAIYSADTCDYCLHGCTYSEALNYNEEATINVGYCILDSLGISPDHAIPLNFHNGYAMEFWSSQAGTTMPIWPGAGGRAYYSLQVSEFTAIMLSLKGGFYGIDMVMHVHISNGEELEYLTYSDDAVGSIPELVLWAQPEVEYIISVCSYSAMRYANQFFVAKVLPNCQSSLSGPSPNHCDGYWDDLGQGDQFDEIISWIINETDTVSNPSSLNLYSFDPGEYSFRLIVDHEICPIDTTYLVTVHPRPLVIAPIDITLCPGDTVLLQAESDWPIVWSNLQYSPTVIWPNNSPVVVSSTRTFWASVTDDYNCRSSDGFSVNVNSAVVQSLAEDPYWDGDNLTVDGNANHQWFFNGETIQGANDFTYTPVVSGFYSVLNSLGSCSAMSDVIYVEYLGLECVQLLQLEPQIIIQGQDLVSESTYLLQWMLNGTFINGATDSMYTPNETGYYSLIHSADSCSFVSDPVYFEYIDPLCLALYQSNSDVTLEGSMLSISTDFPVQWYFNELPIDGATSATFAPQASGYYAVERINETCTDIGDPIFFEYINPICADLDLPQIPQLLCSSINWEFAFEGDLNEHFYWIINNTDTTETGYISDDQLSYGQNNIRLATNLQDCPLYLESTILRAADEVSLNILSDSIVCLPDYLFLSAEGQGGNLEWIGGYGNNTNIWLTENTDLVVRVIDDCFVSVYDTLHVQLIERPSFESLPTSDFACIGGSYQLQSNLVEDNVWWGPLPDMSIIQPAQDTLMYVTAVNDFGCVANDSLWLQMDNFPNLEILSAEQVCLGELNYLLQGTSDGEVVWQEGANNTNITILQDSTLYVSATSEGGCVTNDSIMVELIELPDTELSFSNDTLYAPPASSYQWYLNGAPIFVPDNNWLALVVAGAYTVVMSNELGCEVTSEIFNYISVDEYGGMDLRMYPNPANSHTTLVWKDGLLDFTIVNSIGEIVAKYDNQTSPFVMSISEWSNGLYYIALRQDEHTIHLPLIKSE